MADPRQSSRRRPGRSPFALAPARG